MYNLLFVDDDSLITESFANILRWAELGLNLPLIANDYNEAVALLKRSRVDILISDIEMLGNDGFELIAWTREHYPKIICCILTCHARFDFARQAIKLGAIDYLLKPICESDLKEMLLRSIGRLRNTGTTPSPKYYSRAVCDAMEYIQKHLGEVISREIICQKLFISERHLSRLFHQELGISLTDYITACRIERAKELLEETDFPVTDIGSHVGFSYPAYFAKVFRERTGMSPVGYRKSMREQEN